MMDLLVWLAFGIAALIVALVIRVLCDDNGRRYDLSDEEKDYDDVMSFVGFILGLALAVAALCFTFACFAN
jgi:hypothetical protein